MIEIGTTTLFFLTFSKIVNCYHGLKGFFPFGQSPLLVGDVQSDLICNISLQMSLLSVPILLILIFCLLMILVIDMELQIIPDTLVLLLSAVALPYLLLIHPEVLYENLLAGFGAATFFLALHLITKGKGMGLGDVKLALPLGFLVGLRLTALWLFASFILGAVVGLVLIWLGKARMGRPIAFGPFIVLAFLLTLFWGDALAYILLPYW